MWAKISLLNLLAIFIGFAVVIFEYVLKKITLFWLSRACDSESWLSNYIIIFRAFKDTFLNYS